MSFIGNTPTQQAFIPAVDFFNGNGSTTAFTLSRPVASVAQVQAVISNVPQTPGTAYTVSGNTITFTSAPPSGTNNIYVYYTSPITQVIAPGQGTVGSDQLQSSINITTLSTTNGATVQGLTVGKGAGAVSTNTAVGASALNANTTGARNTALGNLALAGNTTTTYSDATAIGYNALYQGGGGKSTAIGAGALSGELAAGGTNTAVGYNALTSDSSGGSNVGIGAWALQANTTASNNTAVGYQAGYSNTTGAENSFLGYLAGNANTTGSQNTFIGRSSGVTNQTGTEIVAVGFSAMGACGTAANYNTAIGRAALNNVTGTLNVGLGNGSGSAITSGSKNTIIGSYSGNQGGLDIRTTSNYIVLSDGDGNPRAHINQYGTLIMQVGTSAAPPVNANIANSIHLGNGSMGTATVNPTVFFGNVYATSGGVPVYCGNWPASNNWAVGLHDGGSSRNIRIGGATVDTGGMRWDGAYANIYAGSYTNASDYRIKENVVALEVGVLASVMALRPVKYRIKKIEGDEQDNRTEIGFIAHELQAQFPELVMGEKDAVDASGNEQHQGVDYAKMTAVLVKAIQELKAEFDAYKEAHP